MAKDKNFKKSVFDNKVKQHIDFGYSKDMAEFKVSHDYNIRLDKSGNWETRKNPTDKDGNFKD